MRPQVEINKIEIKKVLNEMVDRMQSNDSLVRKYSCAIILSLIALGEPRMISSSIRNLDVRDKIFVVLRDFPESQGFFKCKKLSLL